MAPQVTGHSICALAVMPWKYTDTGAPPCAGGVTGAHASAFPVASWSGMRLLDSGQMRAGAAGSASGPLTGALLTDPSAGAMALLPELATDVGADRTPGSEVGVLAAHATAVTPTDIPTAVLRTIMATCYTRTWRWQTSTRRCADGGVRRVTQSPDRTTHRPWRHPDDR